MSRRKSLHDTGDRGRQTAAFASVRKAIALAVELKIEEGQGGPPPP